jgi:glycosyltransferase involved in cell wall biosynthesis
VNTLYLTYDGLTDPLGQSQILPYLSGISKKGYLITIISCEKKDRLLKDGDAIRKLLSEYNISWIIVPYSNSIPIVSPLIILYKMWRKSKEKLISETFSLIHCRSTLPAIVGLKLKEKFKIPYIFDMRGFWADERVEGNIWPQDKWIYRLLYKWVKHKEKSLYSKADHVISLTESAKKILKNNSELKSNVPVTVIPCCADFNLFNPANIFPTAINSKKEELSIDKDASVIIYTGSIGTWYMLDEMLQFFKIYLHKKPGSKFLFVTKENHDLILATAKQYGISKDDIRITSSGRNDMPLYLSLANASLFFIKPVYSKLASSPVKQGESLAMGVPVITNSGIGDSDEIITSHNFGWIVNSFDDKSYASAIEKMITSTPDQLLIRNNAQNILSLEKGIERYLTLYDTCLMH